MPGMNMPARKRRGPITLFCESRPFRWTAIAVVFLPVLYLTSFGPACWISSRTNTQALPAAYLPIGWLLGNSPRLIVIALVEYAQVGMPTGSRISIPAEDGIVSVILR
jgi:hypothetical protein